MNLSFLRYDPEIGVFLFFRSFCVKTIMKKIKKKKS